METILGIGAILFSLYLMVYSLFACDVIDNIKVQLISIGALILFGIGIGILLV